MSAVAGEWKESVHGSLAGQHTLGVVQVTGDLLRALSHGVGLSKVVMRGSERVGFVKRASAVKLCRGNEQLTMNLNFRSRHSAQVYSRIEWAMS